MYVDVHAGKFSSAYLPAIKSDHKAKVNHGVLKAAVDVIWVHLAEVQVHVEAADVGTRRSPYDPVRIIHFCHPICKVAIGT